MLTRKDFLKQSLAISAGFYGLSNFVVNPDNLLAHPLQRNNPWFELPKGFKAKVISEKGKPMSDGFLVPGYADGMGTFSISGKTIIVRNHELSPGDLEDSPFGTDNRLLDKLSRKQFFDYGHGKNPSLGGTSTIIFNEQTGEVEKEYMSLVGTNRNCAGGITPWDSWISCEEDVTQKTQHNETDHGYNFEVPADSTSIVDPVPLKDMGRFNHEAVSVNPESGYVYQTEDAHDGLIYRFLPNHKGELHKGGKLQTLKIKGEHGFDTRNWKNKELLVGQILDVEWITLSDVTPKEDDLRLRGRQQGAAVFARGEGMWYGNNEIYFACTNGGNKKLGQVFRYIPSPEEGQKSEFSDSGKLQLFAESDDKDTLKHCDNLTVAPWGDVILCEDSSDAFIRGITPQGEHYNIARNIYSDSELAGSCFSPSGKYMFINIQSDGLTLAITGPWQNLHNA